MSRNNDAKGYDSSEDIEGEGKFAESKVDDVLSITAEKKELNSKVSKRNTHPFVHLHDFHSWRLLSYHSLFIGVLKKELSHCSRAFP